MSGQRTAPGRRATSWSAVPHTRLVLTAGVAAVAAALALPAAAAAPRTGELTCGEDAFAVEGRLYGAALSVAGSTQNFVVTYLQVDETGECSSSARPARSA